MNTLLTCLLLLILGLLPAPSAPGADSPEGLFSQWLAAQTNLHTLAADFVQTRSLRSLAQPIRTPGRLYFAAPAQFRWELGTPPQTIALRQTNRLAVIYPPQKRVETYDLGTAGSQWREILALMEAGFPRSRAELESRYRLERLSSTNDLLEVTLVPRHPTARRLIPELTLGLAPRENRLCFSRLKMADGSEMRQDYTNIAVNPVWPESPFVWTPPPDYRVVEPLPARRPSR